MTDGVILTSPLVVTSGVFTSIADVSVVTCCMTCSRISHCTGVFYNSVTAVCQPYHFSNYTSLNVLGKENFVQVVSGAHKISTFLLISFGYAMIFDAIKMVYDNCRKVSF
jgi:hypothetical protein